MGDVNKSYSSCLVMQATSIHASASMCSDVGVGSLPAFKDEFLSVRKQD